MIKVSPFIRKGCGSFLTAAALSLLIIWTALWRSLTINNISIISPVKERDFRAYRRSRNIKDYLIDGAEPLITPQNHECQTRSSIPVVVLVTSAPGNSRERNAIRKTWASTLPTFFFLGRDAGVAENLDGDLVENYIEARQHGDIIVINMDDTYENLPIKVGHMLDWARVHCPTAEFVFKTDDDVFVNPWTLETVLTDNSDKQLIGYKKPPSYPHRDKENKWYIPNWLYADGTIPEYLSGTGYIIAGRYLDDIMEASSEVPLINLEDVYFTSLVASQKLGLNLTHEPRMSPHTPLMPTGCSYYKLASAHSFKSYEIETIWSRLKDVMDAIAEEKTVCKFGIM